MGETDRRQKMLFQFCAKFIMGEETGLRLKGRPDSLTALREVLCASRDVYRALEDRKSLEEVHRLLERKGIAAQEFRRQTGLTWTL